MLIANSNLVGKWANWEYFANSKRKGLMMYGQMTAGSWIYIGTQGIVQGTYETFAEAGREAFWRRSCGQLIVTGGMGGMGGAQPLAATMTGGVASSALKWIRMRIQKRVEDALLRRHRRIPRRGS